jgi:4-amino-4-deoxy-L-arabinose transferase-like glycosyltransferase
MERRYELIVLLIASAIFLTGILSPPSLMDDMDAVQAQMARNMVQSGDWVTPRLDGVVYLEKAPLKTWMTAVCYVIFGVHDWAARLPVALAAILVAWVVARFGRWAFSPKTGFYAGLVTATCVGLFLFTRAVMPDVLLTLAVTAALWSFLRALDENEARPRMWAYLLVGRSNLRVLAQSGGKTLFTNQAIQPPRAPHAHRD